MYERNKTVPTVGERKLTSRVILAFGLVALAHEGRGFLVIAGHGDKRFVRYAALDFLAPGEADNRVAAFDVVIEKVERLAGIASFQPEGDLAQFDDQGVQIHAVDTFADDVADRGAEGRG